MRLDRLCRGKGLPLQSRTRGGKALSRKSNDAQLTRPSDYESEGRTFESFRARQQLFEQNGFSEASWPAASTHNLDGSNMEAWRCLSCIAHPPERSPGTGHLGLCHPTGAEQLNQEVGQSRHVH
jgi:hypothetical protein